MGWLNEPLDALLCGTGRFLNGYFEILHAFGI
jgi:hypothetical protein